MSRGDRTETAMLRDGRIVQAVIRASARGEECRSLDSALRAPLGITSGAFPSERSPRVVPSERSESRDLYCGRSIRVASRRRERGSIGFYGHDRTCSVRAERSLRHSQEDFSGRGWRDVARVHGIATRREADPKDPLDPVVSAFASFGPMWRQVAIVVVTQLSSSE